MKKVFAALLSFIMIVSVSACGDDVPEDSVGVSGENTFSLSESSEEMTVGAIASAVASGDIPDEASEAETEPGDSISIVVLGDSIARGYGLKDIERERFSSVLGEKLKLRFNNVTVSNFGVDGWRGSELSASLKADVPEELKECDVVIISIGGNNVLLSLAEFSGVLEPFGDISPDVITDYFFYLFPPEGSEKSDYKHAVDTINALFKSVNDVFYSDAYKNSIKECADDLKKEIPEIVGRIRKVNPGVRILIQTVYNPYKNLDISLIGIDERLSLGAYGKESVGPINQVITGLSEKNGYEAVPVYERFEESGLSLVNAGFNIMTAKFSLDPHPNAYGHAYIAEIYYKLLTEDNNE